MEASKARSLLQIEMDCPSCDATHTRVLEVRPCANGTKRRRYCCLSCDYRWTVWDGDRPMKGGRPGHRQSIRTQPSIDDIRLVLTRRDLNNKQAGNIIGRSAECVRQIRCGKSRASTLPDLIRFNATDQQPASDGPNCLECKEWRNGRCSFGFPDPLVEGLTFAADCDLYVLRSQSISLACPISDQ